MFRFVFLKKIQHKHVWLRMLTTCGSPADAGACRDSCWQATLSFVAVAVPVVMAFEACNTSLTPFVAPSLKRSPADLMSWSDLLLLLCVVLELASTSATSGLWCATPYGAYGYGGNPPCSVVMWAGYYLELRHFICYYYFQIEINMMI